MAPSVTVTETEDMQQLVDDEVTRNLKAAVGEESTGVWGAIETFLNWLKTKVRTLLQFYATIFVRHRYHVCGHCGKYPQSTCATFHHSS